MSVNPSGRYSGRYVDSTYTQPSRHQIQPRSGFEDSYRGARDGGQSFQEPQRQEVQKPHQIGGQRGYYAGYEDRHYSDRYSTPQGPREPHPLPGSPPRPKVSPGGKVHPSRLALVPIVPAPGDRNGSFVETPSLDSHQSSASRRPIQPKSPSISLLSGTSLESLDKLRQFKAEVEASRRQRSAPDLEPGKLARMAESFLLSQDREPGEARESSRKPTATMSPSSREQELKERLRSRLKSHDADSSVGGKHEREVGEIIETEHKRSRSKDPQWDRVEIRSRDDEISHDQPNRHAPTVQPLRDRIDEVSRAENRTPMEPRRYAEPSMQPQKTDEKDSARKPVEERRKDMYFGRNEKDVTQRPLGERREPYRLSETNFVPKRFQSVNEPKSQLIPTRQPQSSKQKGHVEHGNCGRFTKRSVSPPLKPRESSRYDRQSLRE